jgi:hypothetical protein
MESRAHSGSNVTGVYKKLYVAQSLKVMAQAFFNGYSEHSCTQLRRSVTPILSHTHAIMMSPRAYVVRSTSVTGIGQCSQTLPGRAKAGLEFPTPCAIPPYAPRKGCRATQRSLRR